MKSSNVIVCTLLLIATAGHAQMASDMVMPKAASTAAVSSSALTDGVVQKIDKSSGMVTLKHGEIANMGMPPMTMAFKVRESKMLDQVKKGDKVRFHLEKVNGAPTVTRMERAE